MLMNELIKISGDLSLSPTKIITSWGTEKNENSRTEIGARKTSEQGEYN